jgi:hypothetical protein
MDIGVRSSQSRIGGSGLADVYPEKSNDLDWALPRESWSSVCPQQWKELLEVMTVRQTLRPSHGPSVAWQVIGGRQ